MTSALPPSALYELALSDNGERSALSAQPFLLVDFSHGNTFEMSEPAALAAWLQRLPCPTIAIAENADAHPLLRAFDVIAGDDIDAQALIATIEHAPIAAMTFVQVLRVTADMVPAQALTVESLAYSTLQAGPEYQRWLAQNPPRQEPIVDAGPPVIVERREQRLLLQLNRPSRRNAISVEMRDALVEALQLAVIDASIEQVEISGIGACFSIGGDLTEFGTAPDPASAHAIRSQRLPGAVLVQCAGRVRFHVHSACIGAGMEIPAFGHHISASKKTFFQLPELRFGLIPGAGGCISLPRRIGRQRTAWLGLSGKKINAATALDWGLVDELIPD